MKAVNLIKESKNIIKAMFFLLMTVLFSACRPVGNNIKSPNMIIAFGDHFSSDTISLKINGVEVFRDQIVTSNPSDGISDVVLYLYFSAAERIDVKPFGRPTVSRALISKSNPLTMEIEVNRNYSKNLIDTSLGKYVNISKAFNGSLLVRQMKRSLVN